MIEAIGIDGCPAGWIAAVAHADGSTALRLLTDDLGVLLDEAERQAGRPPVVGIDVPMGLPARAGHRPCDLEARALLGRAKASSVFPSPDRELLGLDFAAAREVVHARRAADPAGVHPVMTHQAMNIAPKIAEVDALLTPARQAWIVEAHPELSVTTLAGAPLAPKRTPEGRAARERLLTGVFPDLAQRRDAAGFRRKDVAPDDLLDAYAALWSARRHARGQARVLGDLEARDDRGLLMRLVV